MFGHLWACARVTLLFALLWLVGCRVARPQLYKDCLRLVFHVASEVHFHAFCFAVLPPAA